MEEQIVDLEGPDHFLDVVYEAIDAHIQRTGGEYEDIITHVESIDAGEIDPDTAGSLRLYIRGDTDPEEAYDVLGLALDRIADENNMNHARQNVQLIFAEEEEEEF